MAMTKKEEKRWTNDNIQTIIDQHKVEGTYQENQLDFNSFCNLIEKCFNESLKELNKTGETYQQTELLTDEQVEVFSSEFNINDYNTVSKTKLKAAIANLTRSILLLNKDGGKYVDFSQRQPESALKGVIPNDHLLVKIENNGVVFFIKFINEIVTFTNHENGNTKKALEIHKFMPVVGFAHE